MREAIGEVPEPPPFSSEEVDVSSSDWPAFNWSDRVLTLDAVSEHSDEMAVVMVGMVTAELLDAICEWAISSPVSSTPLPPDDAMLVVVDIADFFPDIQPPFDELLLSTIESTLELPTFDEGSDAEGLRPPPAPLDRCLMFSRLLILNVSSSDWLDIHESFVRTEPPYMKSPI